MRSSRQDQRCPAVHDSRGCRYGGTSARSAPSSRRSKGIPWPSAGLKVGDAVVEIDGKVVHSASDVRNRVGLREAGSSVTITYSA